MSFRFKLALGITLLQTCLLLGLIFSSLHFQQTSNEKDLLKQAHTAALLFASAAKDAVLNTDLAALENIVAEVMSGPDIVYARVSDTASVLAQRGDPLVLKRVLRPVSEIGSVQDGIFDIGADIQIHGVSYGRVEIGLSVEAIRARMREARAQMLALALAAIALADLFSFLLGLYLTRRLAVLTQGTHQLAAGDLGYQIEVRGNDELADNARAFNQMSSQLQANAAELKESRVLLEQRVVQRTLELSQALAQLQAREAELKALLENSPDLIARFDRSLHCVYVNRVAENYFGLSQNQLLGRGAAEFGFDIALQEALQAVLGNGGEYQHEFTLGGRFLEGRFVPEYDEKLAPDGQAASLLAIIRDVSARRLAEESLRLANRAIESSVNPIIIASCLENDYPIKYVNPAFERVTGYTAAQALGRNARFLHRDEIGDEAPEYGRLRAALAQQSEVQVVVRNYRRDGSMFWNELNLSPVTDSRGAVTHFIAEIHDISDRREQQQQLLHQASHDALTGLPNRNLLMDRLSQAIGYAQRYVRQVVVAFIDLDKFKFVNDSMGHDVGDQLLIQVAARLNQSVRESDTVARLGGDEFVVLLYDQANEDATFHAMQRMLGNISKPMQLAGREFIVTCSIGFAVYPQDGESAATLLKNADTAMYRAKELGRDNYQFYTEDMHSRINERLALEAGLRTAIEHEEFVLHYQPQLDLRTGKVSGLEALIRWNHPQLGQIPPQRFIPLAEEIGLIQAIGDWVLRQACRQQVALRNAGLSDVPMAVNVCAAQFMHPGFAASVAGVLHDTGIAPAMLELEITETVSMKDPDASIRVLHELKQMGIKLAIDDFGTGYSNLSYLKRFPVDKLKLDQSFVRDIVHSADDLAIADAVIAVAHSLRLRLVAEGIERAAQLVLLADHGCDEMQGFYFSRPLPTEACAALLREGRALPLQALGRSQEARTLLLVDDEPNMLSALERSLRHSASLILRANNAHEAFDLLAQHEVGVILSDQKMPGMSGVEFFSQVRHMHPDSVRIILSGAADMQAATDAINLGAVYRFLNKPWEDDALNAAIRVAFETYRTQKRLRALGGKRQN